MKDLSLWKKRIKKLDKAKNKIRLFKDFAEIETEFEELELILMNAATELDSAIQHQIDIARGK